MDRELFNAIGDDIKARSAWADRQAIWYQMRRDGLRRKNKPFPGAADMHFPLIDSVIEKFKPFYINQLFATERLADFISKNPQAGERMTDAAWWFDYKLKQQSNLEREAPFAFDSTLQNGRGILKVTWDADKKRIHFDSIEPIYLIVPSDTDELQNADRLVHVQHFSPWKYKNGKGHENRNQDSNFINSITGGEIENEAQPLEDVKKRKEGITHTSCKDVIILWEVYERTKEGWDVHTISPIHPDKEVRPVFGLPYSHGFAPFVDFPFEETDKSYYSPRGIAEIAAPFESSLCKQWNEKHDAMSFYNRPLFYTDRDIPNAGNIKMRPGDILPFKIAPVDRGNPPISWDQEMTNTRMVAEQRVATPDFGIGGDNGGDNKTAREVDEISATRNQVVDMRSRLTRRQLGALYNQAWELLKQYDIDLEFLKGDAFGSLDEVARNEVLTLKPNGSSEAWNQHARLKKAVGRMQLLGSSPFINQGALVKSILELDEPGLVGELYRDPQIKQQDQVERIMRDIPALEEGLFIQPRPDDDDAIHADFLMEYLARNEKVGKPVTSQGLQSLQARLKAHMDRLQQTNPQAAAQLKRKGIEIARSLQPATAQPQPQGMAA